MKYRLLTGLAAAPYVLMSAGPADAAAVTEPQKQAADSVAMLAGSMVVGAAAAFAAMAMVRRHRS